MNPLSLGNVPMATLDDVLIREMLKEIVRRGYRMHYFGRNPREPELIAAVYRWPQHRCADAVILRGKTDATAYRAECGPSDDPLRPRCVDYLYQDSALWTMRAILTIGAPGTPTAPRDHKKPTSSCFIPDELGRAHTISPPMVRVG